jgi:hypothetical protein
MLGAFARLLILRILPRRLIPVLTLYEAYRFYRNHRRRQMEERWAAESRAATKVTEREQGRASSTGFSRRRHR